MLISQLLWKLKIVVESGYTHTRQETIFDSHLIIIFLYVKAKKSSTAYFDLFFKHNLRQVNQSLVMRANNTRLGFR